jgi:hypothetical protein
MHKLCVETHEFVFIWSKNEVLLMQICDLQSGQEMQNVCVLNHYMETHKQMQLRFAGTKRSQK